MEDSESSTQHITSDNHDDNDDYQTPRETTENWENFGADTYQGGHDMNAEVYHDAQDSISPGTEVGTEVGGGGISAPYSSGDGAREWERSGT